MSTHSRRDLIRSLLNRCRNAVKVEACERGDIAARDVEENPPPFPAARVAAARGDAGAPGLALILDRFCLAWQGSFCSVCVERCPVPGAILTERGRPRIDPDVCTGCQICQEVCPAPKNAIFLVARKPRPGMIGRTVSETEPTPTIA